MYYYLSYLVCPLYPPFYTPLRGRSDHDLPSCWLRRLAAVVSGKRLACAEPLRPMVILSVIEAIFEIPTC